MQPLARERIVGALANLARNPEGTDFANLTEVELDSLQDVLTRGQQLVAEAKKGRS